VAESISTRPDQVLEDSGVHLAEVETVAPQRVVEAAVVALDVAIKKEMDKT